MCFVITRHPAPRVARYTRHYKGFGRRWSLRGKLVFAERASRGSQALEARFGYVSRRVSVVDQQGGKYKEAGRLP
jgi:hypothetical protein